MEARLGLERRALHGMFITLALRATKASLANPLDGAGEERARRRRRVADVARPCVLERRWQRVREG